MQMDIQCKTRRGRYYCAIESALGGPRLSTGEYLALFCQQNHVIRLLDVETAFLSGVLNEGVFINSPEETKLPDGMVARSRQSIYGPQASSSSVAQNNC
ncbi:hypothetical protein Plhal304r1_c030g0097851 [Plasmopara halstedii]